MTTKRPYPLHAHEVLEKVQAIEGTEIVLILHGDPPLKKRTDRWSYNAPSGEILGPGPWPKTRRVCFARKPLVRGLSLCRSLTGEQVMTGILAVEGAPLPADPTALQETIRALRAELWEQWRANHVQYCGPTWPHAPRVPCLWPVPPILQEETPPLRESPPDH